MAVTLKQVESPPEKLPTLPLTPQLSTGALALNFTMIWQRIEAYVVHRWSVRDVIWTVEGPGDWQPPLTPWTVTLIEEWTGSAWSTVTPDPSPFGGYVLPDVGPYRITGTAGAGPVPAQVAEAFARLAEYMADGREYSMWKGRPGATSVDVNLGSITQRFNRNQAWLARAMVNSGAADLLRPYREAV